jgi:uncharacterized protein DUF5681
VRGIVADLDLIKQQIQQTKRPRGRAFPKGVSGNPAGRPRGCRDKINRVAEILLDGEAEVLTRKAVQLALGGDPTALSLCVERIAAPRRQRAVEFSLPPIKSAADLAGAMEAIVQAAARGIITPGDAVQFFEMAEAMSRVIETADFERRLQELEAAAAASR